LENSCPYTKFSKKHFNKNFVVVVVGYSVALVLIVVVGGGGSVVVVVVAVGVSNKVVNRSFM
jgi:hypothetical protein